MYSFLYSVESSLNKFLLLCGESLLFILHNLHGRISWIFSFSFMDSCTVFLMPEVKIHSYMFSDNDNESLIESINRFSKRL